MPEVAELLLRWQQQGDKSALDEMMPAVYNELRRLARYYLSGEREDHTLQPTELVHEAYSKLVAQREVDWRNKAQFLGVAAKVMRRVLLHHGESRSAQKRTMFTRRVELDEALECLENTTMVDIVSLDTAVRKLEAMDPRQAEIVELRVFGGLTIEEAAEVLTLSASTIKREWKVAQLWLRKELS